MTDTMPGTFRIFFYITNNNSMSLFITSVPEMRGSDSGRLSDLLKVIQLVKRRLEL